MGGFLSFFLFNVLTRLNGWAAPSIMYSYKRHNCKPFCIRLLFIFPFLVDLRCSRSNKLSSTEKLRSCVSLHHKVKPEVTLRSNALVAHSLMDSRVGNSCKMRGR